MNSSTFSRFALTACALLALSGCMKSNPMGFSDNEWASLSPEQKYEARMKQSKIDERKRQERAEAKALEKENERQRKEMIAMRYQNAKHGDIVQCVMNKTVIDYSKGWKDADKLGFTLVRGEFKELKSWSKDKRHSVTLYADMSDDGMNINFCRFKSTSVYQQRKYCQGITATTKQLESGMSQRFDIPKYMRGTLYCSVKPMHIQKDETKVQKLTIKNVFKSIFD